jgi:serine/threonine protein kinase
MRQDIAELRVLVGRRSTEEIEGFLLIPANGDTFKPLPGKPDEFYGTFDEHAVIYTQLFKPAHMQRLSQYLNELCILRKLSEFEHVHKFYGIQIRDDTVYMLREYAARGTLSNLLTRSRTSGNLPSSLKISIAHKIAKTVHSLHQSNVLHKSISCESVLISDKWEPRLTGFEHSRKVCLRYASARYELYTS